MTHHPACTQKPYPGGGCKCRWPEIVADFKGGNGVDVVMAKFRKTRAQVHAAIRGALYNV